MAMITALFDTNILIDYLKGIAAAKRELERYDRKAISLVTWMEVMVGTTKGTGDKTRTFLATFEICPITEHIAERVLEIQKKNRMELPAAIVWATAINLGYLLVTRDVRDFPADEPGIRIPYKI